MGISRHIPRANRSATVSPTVNDDITLGYVVGSQWNDTTADRAYICHDNTDGAAVWIESSTAKSAAAAPTVNDDLDLGYTVGSRWTDTTADITYVCVDNTNGAAVWRRTGSATEARIKTGTYTGDGTEGQAITGVGFQPKFVKIWNHPAAEANWLIYEKLDQTWTDYAIEHGVTATSEHRSLDSRINSLDADGFTVDDDGIDASPNVDTATYDYLALG